jgi:hypothetical protein
LIDNCEIANPFARQLYMFGGQIYTDSQGAMLCELQQVASSPASDFEDFFSPMLAKLRNLV